MEKLPPIGSEIKNVPCPICWDSVRAKDPTNPHAAFTAYGIVVHIEQNENYWGIAINYSCDVCKTVDSFTVIDKDMGVEVDRLQ